MAKIKVYFKQSSDRVFMNRWDMLAIFFIFSALFIFAWGATQMSLPYNVGEQPSISLDPKALPFYAIRSVLRMALALLLSLLVTLTLGTLAAKNKRAEKIIIPLVDVLQSIPVLSFLSITILFFIRLFPGSMLGPECASIFAIFTAQAWNMVLGFYQSVRTVPHDLKEAARMCHLNQWQRFWRIDVPFSLSSLIWNMMMSMSASWFFVVASEAISVSNQDIRLPGIGSYIGVAIHEANQMAVAYAIIAMFIVITFYDQFVFRPLLQWSEKYQVDLNPQEKNYRSWFFNLLGRTRLVRALGLKISLLADLVINSGINPFPGKIRHPLKTLPIPRFKKYASFLSQAGLFIVLLACSTWLLRYIMMTLSVREIWHVFWLGTATGARVLILVVLSSLLWIPVGVYIGQRPRLCGHAQPLIQFLAAFPANLLFPIVGVAIVHYHLNVEIWTTPLMILGSQWYILFNVIAGTQALPRDFTHVSDNLHIKGWLWWKRLGFPGVFPYFITGAITAAGGAWNASIVAEWVTWGDTTLVATGLGAYIAQYTAVGDFPRIALGTSMMCAFVLLFNALLWRPLTTYSQERFSLMS